MTGRKPRQRLLNRDEARARAEGYLGALENVERMGTELQDRLSATVTSTAWNDDGSAEALPLFQPPPDQSALSARTAKPSSLDEA